MMPEWIYMLIGVLLGAGLSHAQAMYWTLMGWLETSAGNHEPMRCVRCGEPIEGIVWYVAGVGPRCTDCEYDGFREGSATFD